MGRPIVLSNGQLFVGLDERGLVNDFYFPYVGQDNLTDARSMHHKIGVWCDGRFSWLDDPDWHISLESEDMALIGHVTYISDDHQIEITTEDTVDYSSNTFLRGITVKNMAAKNREIRIFMHQVFRISQNGRADTACYVPDDHYILNYKGRQSLGVGGCLETGEAFDQFAVGNFGIEGKTGTFMDAEDGELSGNLVEHGGVDSVIRFRADIAANSQIKIYYWIVAASAQSDVRVHNRNLNATKAQELLESTRSNWRMWIEPAAKKLKSMPENERTSVLKSLLTIKAHTDKRGAVLASGDSSIFNYGRDYYCYCWPRDAVYALWPLIRLGIYTEALGFFRFAQDVMHPDGYLLHKYQPDRSIGSTWHSLLNEGQSELAIQEDETASVVRLMGEYFEATQDQSFLQEYYEAFVRPCANFMASFIDKNTTLPHASYDLWEQKFLTSTYTVCTVIAGLQSAADMAIAYNKPHDAEDWQSAAHVMQAHLGAFYHPDGFLRKGLLLLPSGDLQFDNTLDISSLYGPYMHTKLGLENEMIRNTARAVESRLLNSSPGGGVIRYEHDGYFLRSPQYKGNPWIVCTAWLAQYYISNNRHDEARTLLEWMYAKQSSTGILSEQYDAESGNPIGVMPLVWSHAELANTILDYYNI
jgi:GH15 family glucan-1,4-alpha-glucosidase